MKPLYQRDRVLTPTRLRAAYLLIAVAAFWITEALRRPGRRFVRSHGLDDFGITGSIGNFGGILVQIFLTLAVLNPKRGWSLAVAAFLALGYIAYEFAQPHLPKGVFDPNDIAATLLGLLVATVALVALWRLFPENEFPPGDE